MPDLPSKAIFLSHASQDSDAARRICDGLRSKGVEVWFDSDGGLEHGDEWDAKIRRQIRDCVLFIPLISAATQARHEGYFRIEWDLAAERARGFASGVPFILPILIDATREPDALVPDRFRAVQWTKLPEGLVTPEFLNRFLKVWSHRTGVLSRPGAEAAAITSSAGNPSPAPPRKAVPWRMAAAVLLGALGIAGLWFLSARRSGAAAGVGLAAGAGPTAPNSVAVLAFENLSDDKSNEYFSDGISEELLSVLAKVPGMHVAARTSSFYFKGRKSTTEEIGEKLHVANLVEGSVRRAGNSVRIAARLSRAATGEDLWSETYTRDVSDVFAVQSELAQTIVAQLRQQLGAPASPEEIAAQVRSAERGGTTNVEAHQLFLQGQFYVNSATLENLRRARDGLRRAVELDPHYALAWVLLSECGGLMNGFASTRAEVDEGMALARRAGERALQLDPHLAGAHLALAEVAMDEFDWAAAAASLTRARQLDPDNPQTLLTLGQLNLGFGRVAEGVEVLKRCAALDPINSLAHTYVGVGLAYLRRLDEARAHFQQVLAISPDFPFGTGGVSDTLRLEGKFDQALALAEQNKTEWLRLTEVATLQWLLGRHAESDHTLQELQERYHEVAAYQVAEVYASRGNRDAAFTWLETAYRQHDPGLERIRVDPLFDPVAADPRWISFLTKVGLAPNQVDGLTL